MGAKNRFLRDSESLVDAFGGFKRNPLEDLVDGYNVEQENETNRLHDEGAGMKQPQRNNKAGETAKEPLKKITSINVDPVVFKKFKAVASLEGMTVSSKLEQMMLAELKKHNI